MLVGLKRAIQEIPMAEYVFSQIDSFHTYAILLKIVVC